MPKYAGSFPVSRPLHIALNPADGSVFVADYPSSTASAVRVFDQDGRPLRVFRTYRYDSDAHGFARGIAFDEYNDVLVCEGVNWHSDGSAVHLLAIYNQDGKRLASIGRPSKEARYNHQHVVASGRELAYVVNSRGLRVLRRDGGPDGELHAGDAAQLHGPKYLAISEAGELFITDCGNCRVQVLHCLGLHSPTLVLSQIWDPNGIVADPKANTKCLRMFGSKGTADGQFLRPTGIALDGFGRVLVCDEEAHKIQVLSVEGKFIASFGNEGSAEGQFHRPQGICLSSDRRKAFICDLDNNRVQMWTLFEVWLVCQRDGVLIVALTGREK